MYSVCILFRPPSTDHRPLSKKLSLSRGCYRLCTMSFTLDAFTKRRTQLLFQTQQLLAVTPQFSASYATLTNVAQALRIHFHTDIIQRDRIFLHTFLDDADNHIRTYLEMYPFILLGVLEEKVARIVYEQSSGHSPESSSIRLSL